MRRSWSGRMKVGDFRGPDAGVLHHLEKRQAGRYCYPIDLPHLIGRDGGDQISLDHGPRHVKWRHRTPGAFKI